MRTLTSYADHVTNWKKLLKAVETQTDLADLKVKPKLEAVLVKIEEINTRQAEQQAAKQMATQEQKVVFQQGIDFARELRAELASRLGARSEAMVQFGVKPLRLGTRRTSAKATQGGEPEVPTTPAPAPPSGTIANN